MTDDEIYEAMLEDRDLSVSECHASYEQLQRFLKASFRRVALQYMNWCKRQLDRSNQGRAS